MRRTFPLLVLTAVANPRRALPAPGALAPAMPGAPVPAASGAAVAALSPADRRRPERATVAAPATR